MAVGDTVRDPDTGEEAVIVWDGTSDRNRTAWITLRGDVACRRHDEAYGGRRGDYARPIRPYLPHVPR